MAAALARLFAERVAASVACGTTTAVVLGWFLRHLPSGFPPDGFAFPAENVELFRLAFRFRFFFHGRWVVRPSEDTIITYGI